MSGFKSAAMALALGLTGVACSADQGTMGISSGADSSKLPASATLIALDTAAPEKTMPGTAAPGKKGEAEQGTVLISSPVDGSKLPGTSTKIAFDVSAPGRKGDHVHLYVDGEQVAQVHTLKGSYNVDKLAVGKHWLCVRVVDRGHTAVGIEKCVSVIVGNIPSMGY